MSHKILKNILMLAAYALVVSVDVAFGAASIWFAYAGFETLSLYSLMAFAVWTFLLIAGWHKDHVTLVQPRNIQKI